MYDPRSEYQFYGIYTGGLLTYSMEAAPNAATSAVAWQIKKLEYDVSDNLTRVTYPRNSDGNASADRAFIADNYASYTYGPA